MNKMSERYEYDDKDKNEAKKKKQRESTQRTILLCARKLYSELSDLCTLCNAIDEFAKPALICLNSLNESGHPVCGLYNDKFFPLVIDEDYAIGSKRGDETLDTIIENSVKAFEGGIEDLRKKICGTTS